MQGSGKVSEGFWTKSRRSLQLAIGALFGIVLTGGSLLAQEQQPPTGTVAGTVVDAATNAGIPDALVRIAGTARVIRTQPDGRYTIRGIPTGAQTVQVNRLGYATASRSVTVTDGGTATIDIPLAQTTVTLQAEVIQGTAVAASTAREVGASVGVISPDSLLKAPITNLTDLLNSRVAGLTVEQNSGVIGTGARILLRGVSSTALSTEPLLVIDGVRAYNDVNGLSDIANGGSATGGQAVSRYDDLDFESIENVEVLRGPAAAALYGTEAASGVLVITTKHGEPDQHAHWNFFGSLGNMLDQTNYPAQWGRLATAGGAPTCSLEQEFEALCMGLDGANGATGGFDVNVAKADVPITRGFSEGTGLSVSGGSELSTYYIGGDWSRQQGIFQDNGDRWTHATGSFDIHPVNPVELNFTVAYTQRRVDLSQGDNSLEGPLANAMLAQPSLAQPFFASGSTPAELELVPTHSNIDRLTVGGSGTWHITSWLQARGNAGMDYSGIFDSQIFSQAILPFQFPTGAANSADNAVYDYTGSASLQATYPIVHNLSGTTTFGGEWVDETLRALIGSGQGLLPGTGSLAGASSNFSAAEENTDIVNIGGYLQEQFAWRDVLYVTASGRLDGNSAFGRNNSTALYPSGSLSYVISDEDYWHKNDIVSSLRFRLAGGQSGREPTFRLANGSYTSAAYTLQGLGNQTGLIVNTVGNSDLKPERSTEYETGFDIGFFRERVTATVTVYDRAEHDLIQAVPVDPSVGNINLAAPGVNTNLGEIDNRGAELSLNANIFTTRDLSLDLGGTAAIERNKLVNLGTLTPPHESFGISGAVIQEDVAGEPVGAYYAIPYTYKDLNHDGVIEPNEITYGTKPVYIGEPGPRDEWSLTPTLRFLRFFKVNALFDRRDGITVYDGTDAFRCLPFQVGQECNDPKATLKDQAAAVALNSGAYGGPGTEYGYILNGSFLRLREMSFTAQAPTSWSHRFLGGRTASITISARNLALWTPFRGLDPEPSYSTFSNIAAPLPYITQQFFDQPPLRDVTGRIDISW